MLLLGLLALKNPPKGSSFLKLYLQNLTNVLTTSSCAGKEFIRSFEKEGKQQPEPANDICLLGV